MIAYVADGAHYDEVVARIGDVRHDLWLGTADLKDLYVARRRTAEPLLAVLAELVGRGVSVRLLHAKEPGPNFRADFDRYPVLVDGLERALCPRVHLKVIVFDFVLAYIGSANLTGAGIGMKGDVRRNFEAGVLTDEPVLVERAIEQFDAIWRGDHCAGCG
ncbi:MAG: phospholipase D-like domain-containing protein, partial [Actinomycetia bacterium]|nr:phospholipase D-like domain-containing protein [Actinomycetes bacterium]